MITALNRFSQRRESLSRFSFLLRSSHMRNLLFLAALCSALPCPAAERIFNFTDVPLDQAPPDFRSSVAGVGKPGTWKVVTDDIAPLFAPLTAKGPSTTRRPVLAQLGGEARTGNFPMLTFEPDTFDDFKFATRFKIVGGIGAQVAGIVFRVQNESNYYALVADTVGQHFLFFKVIDGLHGNNIGPKIEIQKDAWHEMSVECIGNQIQCRLDGKDLIPALSDNSFGRGKIGFFTMADSAAHFTDAAITYTPREVLAQRLVRNAVTEYPRLVGLRIFAPRSGKNALSVIASKDPLDLGTPAGTNELDVINRGISYYGKDKGTVTITAPLRDRNGDPIAAVQVVLKSFPGETRDAAMVRSQTILHGMQQDVASLEELVQ
jgi:hypothetical protein